MNQKELILKTIDDLKSQFTEIAKTHNDVVFEQECLFAKQLLENNSYLMTIASGNPVSLKNAILNISSIGLSLNPVLKYAYLVPRKGKICLDPSYIGLTHLAVETGSIRFVQAHLVYENDSFAFEGVGKIPTHKFDPFSEDRGRIKGVYCVAKTSDGDHLVSMMSKKEVDDIRDRSEGWKAYQKDKSKLCPWVTDYSEMTKKTIIKQASKLWPKSERTVRLDHAVMIENENNGIEFENNEQEIVKIEAVNYQEKEKKVELIRSQLKNATIGLSLQEMGKFMVVTCKVKKFDDLNLKTISELDDISKIIELKTAENIAQEKREKLIMEENDAKIYALSNEGVDNFLNDFAKD